MTSGQFVREKGERALARQFGGGFIEGVALVTVKAVVCCVHMHRDFRVRLCKSTHTFKRNPVVLITEMRYDRTLGCTRDFIVSRIRNRDAGEISWNWDLTWKVLVYVVLPLLTSTPWPGPLQPTARARMFVR